MGTPPADVVIDEALIAGLIRDQVPWLSHESVEIVANGWDNVTARLGEQFAARLPRREVAVPLIRNEHRWLAGLADSLDVAVPAPVYCGTATNGYPWPWSVVPWIDGRPAERDPLKPGEAASLGRILASLHRPAPGDAPSNPFRGVPLVDRDDGVRRRLAGIAARRADLAPVCEAARSVWATACAAPFTDSAVWIHGDLHGRNVISDDGRIVGIIDWGDMAAGDRATDLASVWTLFDEEDHERFWTAYPHRDDGIHERTAGWAVAFGTMLLAAGLEDDGGFEAMGNALLSRVTRRR